MSTGRALGRAARLMASGGLLLWAGCLIETPQMPQFNTRLQVPIGQERVTGLDLADSLGPLIEADTTGGGPLEMRFSGSLGRIELRDLLQLDVAPVTVIAQVGEIEIPAPPAFRWSLRAGDVLPFPVGPEGARAPVEPFLFSVGPIALGELPGFERLGVAAGEVRVSFTNGLPIAISGSSERALRIILESGIGNVQRLLGLWIVDRELAPGETYTATLDLAGRTIGASLTARIYGGSPGSGGESVTITPAQGVDLAFEASALRAARFQGPPPALSFATGGELDISALASLSWAEVQTGSLSWELHNDLPVAGRVSIELPGLRYASSGQPLTAETRVGAHAETLVTIDLGGRRIESTGLPGGAPFAWRLTVATEAGEASVNVSSQDRVSAGLAPARIELSGVEGDVRPTRLVVEPVRVTIDVPPEMDEAEFQAASVTLDLVNASGAAGRADLTVVGRAGEQSVAVPVSLTIPPGTGDLPGLARLVLDETNSNVLELIHLRPEIVEASGTLLIGDGTTTMSVRAGDYVEGSYTVIAPLRFILTTVTHMGEPFELELDDDVRERVEESIESLVLDGEVENHFPVGAEVEVHFALRAEDLLAMDDLVLRTGRVQAGELDEGGRVARARVTPVELTVAAGDVDLFTAPSLHGVVLVRLFGGEQPVEFRADDYLRFQGRALLEVAVR